MGWGSGKGKGPRRSPLRRLANPPQPAMDSRRWSPSLGPRRWAPVAGPSSMGSHRRAALRSIRARRSATNQPPAGEPLPLLARWRRRVSSAALAQRRPGRRAAPGPGPSDLAHGGARSARRHSASDRSGLWISDPEVRTCRSTHRRTAPKHGPTRRIGSRRLRRGPRTRTSRGCTRQALIIHTARPGPLRRGR